MNFDAFFRRNGDRGWSEVQTICSLTKYTQKDFDKRPALKYCRKLGQAKICSDLADAAKLDLDTLVSQHKKETADLRRQLDAEEDEAKRKSLRSRIGEDPVLPFQVFDDLIRRAFAEWNVDLMATFVQLPPGGDPSRYEAPKLYAHVISKLDGKFDKKTFTEEALRDILKTWRQSMAMTSDKNFYLAEYRKQMAAKRKTAAAAAKRKTAAAAAAATGAATAAANTPKGVVSLVTAASGIPAVTTSAVVSTAATTPEKIVSTAATTSEEIVSASVKRPGKPKRRSAGVLKKRRKKIPQKSRLMTKESPLMTI